jgi:hypothetical protein
MLNRIVPFAVMLASLHVPAAQAATALSTIRYIPDITVNLNGQVVSPVDVANDTLSGAAPTINLAGAPGNLAAYCRRPSGSLGAQVWLVFQTTVSLPGGITATPRDIISYDGLAYAKLFDGATAGIPDGVAIDALSTTNGVDHLISFDTTTTVGGVTAGPEDIVRYAGGGWSAYFDGSSAGVPAGANLDALHYLTGNGHLLVSFDIAGSMAGVGFSAGDVLEYTLGSPGTWERAFSPAALYAGWGAANLRGLWAQTAPAGAAGTLQFSTANYSVNESGGSATITVTRAGGSTGAVSVHYATANGSASQPGDYASSSGTLSWGNGDTAPKTFSVGIVNDTSVEVNETVQLALSLASGATLGSQATATLAILDDDLPANTPIAGASSNHVDFGDQTVGVASNVRTVMVTNNGNATLNITSVSRTGGQSDEYGLQSNTCTGASLAPMASCSIGITFTPGSTGTRATNLSIISNAPASPKLVSLTGNGVNQSTDGSGHSLLAAIPTMSFMGGLMMTLLLGLAGILMYGKSLLIKR